MTGVACRVGDDVVRRLAGSDLVVVAVGTRSECLDVIDESIIAPRRRLVAAFAIIRRHGVGKHRCRARRGHAIVATKACPRRGLETRVDVARRARNADMRASERKSGRIVIELRSRRVLRMPLCGDEQDCCSDDLQHQTYRSQRDHPHLSHTAHLRPAHRFKARRLEREPRNGIDS